jgi:hypothetical protein
MHRAKHSASQLDTSAIRARVMDAVEDALDRAEDALKDAPSATEAAARVRRSRAVEAASTAVAAGVPIAVKALRTRATRKHAMKAARFTAPKVMRMHPVLLGAGVVGGALLGLDAARRLRNRRLADSKLQGQELASGARFDLDEEVARMEDEGGEPGAYATGSTSRRNRFVRSGSSNPATTR